MSKGSLHANGNWSTHEVTKYIQELNEIPHHGPFRGAFGVVEHHMSTPEPSWFANMLESGM